MTKNVKSKAQSPHYLKSTFIEVKRAFKDFLYVPHSSVYPTKTEVAILEAGNILLRDFKRTLFKDILLMHSSVDDVTFKRYVNH